MMIHFRINEISSDYKIIHVYSSIEKQELEKMVHNQFIQDGYKLKEGSIGSGVYEKGNRVKRLIFGAMSKYFKFTVSVDNSEPSIQRLVVVNGTSGMSGGVLGMNQVKSEMKRIDSILRLI